MADAPPPPQEEPAKTKSVLGDIPKWVLVLGLAIVLAGGIVAWAVTNAAKTQKSSEEPAAPQTFTIDGSIEAPECFGGYEITNASVEVRDQTDKLIGAATTSSDVGSGTGCEAEFDVEVPKATFYQIEIGTHGGPSYTFEEMESTDWKLDLFLD